MTLRTKLTSLVSLSTVMVLALVIAPTLHMVMRTALEDAGERALALARSMAATPELVDAFASPNPTAIIQPIAERIRTAAQAEFVVVGNMNLIRYAHPNPSQIGEHMVGEDNDEVLAGRESITQAQGTLGLSVRGKVPVFDRDHRQVGVISVGFLVKGVQHRIAGVMLSIASTGGLALALGLIGAFLLSGHFKKQILGMEPRQIAHAIQEQAAVLEAIREGVLAINADGRIVTCNREAKKVLGFEGVDLTGREVLSVAPTSRLPEVLISGRPQLDQPMVLGKALVITNRVPVLQGGAVVGAVATFRDKLQLEEIESRLATIGRYADDLRAQRHEFSNVLHLVLGLISMSDYDGAMKVIERVNEEHRRAIGFYLARLRDAAVVGILVGKTHRAVELGIQLTVSEDSCVSDTCPHRDAVITILGNAIENALEALRSAPGKASPPEVRVLVREEPHRLVLDVADNGPGVDRTVREHLFEPGATTKGEGRGLGLAIMAKLVAASGGTISCESDGEGTAIRVELPTERTS